MSVFSKRWPKEVFWRNSGGQPKKPHLLCQVHKVDRKKGQWGNRLLSCICITYIPKWLWVSKDLPRNLPFPLFKITVKVSLVETVSVINWLCPTALTLYAELSSVQLLLSFLFYISQCQKPSTKQNKKLWEAYGHIAKGFSNSCLQLTNIVSVSFPFQW